MKTSKVPPVNFPCSNVRMLYVYIDQTSLFKKVCLWPV